MEDLAGAEAIKDQISGLKVAVEEYLRNLEAVFGDLVSDARRVQESLVAETKDRSAKAHGIALYAFNEGLKVTKDSFNQEVEGYLATLEDGLAHTATLLDEVLSVRLEQKWASQRAYELSVASRAPDSYYRYHLLRLTQGKEDAVLAAQEEVSGQWAQDIDTWMLEAR